MCEMRKNRLIWLCISIAFWMGACSTRPVAKQTFTPPPANSENSQVVSVQASPIPPAFKAGRFALQIDSQPPQSFITSFDLTGGWPDGALNIYNPLGMQMARVECDSPLHATNHGESIPTLSHRVRKLYAAATLYSLQPPA